MTSIWKSGIMGVVIGDALGCPVQFKSRDIVEQDPIMCMVGHGTFNLPAGSWTDDSSLTLATLESIQRVGKIDYMDIMENYIKWLDDGEFTPYGYAFDIGGMVRSALSKFKRIRDPMQCGGHYETDNGNGSLMRIMPAVLYCIDNQLPTEEAVEIIHKVGSLTHAHIRSNIACGLYYFMAKSILTESGTLMSRMQSGLDEGFAYYDDYMDQLDVTFTEYIAQKQNITVYDRMRDLESFAALPEDRIRSTGYVVDTLEAVVWALATTDTFKEALLKAVNLGYDSDTVGAVAGGLAGLYYGYNAIPEDWLAAIQRREWIEEMLS